MRIVIGGASGMIGSALVKALRAGGHDVARLVRGNASPGDIHWDPAAGKLDAGTLQGADAVIHLSGEGVASGRWTAAKKQAIRESRIQSTSLLASALASLNSPPNAWLCASAIGWYGSRGDAWLEETDAPGEGFLPGICRDWEAATQPAVNAGVRVVNLRFSVVLSPDGGALQQMMTAFKMGAGGVIGDGRQYMSWITLEDAIRACIHILDNPFIQGPVNIASPEPVTNRALTKSLGAALRRPTLLPMPAFAVRLIFGAEMANEMFLGGTRVRPRKLLDSGFRFTSPTLDEALRNLLAR